MRFIGLDLTDPYAAYPRDIDVAVLDEQLRCELKKVPSSRVHGDVSWLRDVTAGPLSGDVLVIDGPLALATIGRGTRECERQLGTPGHTGDALPVAGTRPFAGYIRGAIELARLLVLAGWRPAINDIQDATMLEAYPGSAWVALAGIRLPHKNTHAGNLARQELLRANEVVLPDGPLSHDALHAVICALIGTFAQGRAPRARPVGLPCVDVDGVMREGFIIQPASEGRKG